jgi:flagellar basal-body rod modification protein FlgD
MTITTVNSATAGTNPQTSAQTKTSSSSSSSSTSSSSKSDSVTGLGDNFQTFLTLLTTQLKNQDPQSPLDTNQFTQQLVEMSSVEQAIKQNDQLKQLIALQSTNQMISSLSLVGNSVEVNSSTAPLTGGSASFAYTVPTGVTAATLNVLDSNGRVVYSQPADFTAGRHQFQWNGQDTSGTTQPDGGYSLQVTATKADNSTATVPVTAIAKVRGVSVQNGATTLDLGSGVSIGADQMVAVRSN